MSSEFIGLIGIILMFLLLCMRMHIGLAMALVGFVGFGVLTRFSIGLKLFGTVPYTTGSMYSFSIIPLFVLMGQFAYASGLSKDIYTSVHRWFGQLPGGLAMATIVGCAGFASICGSSLATAATMGTVALPEMKKYKYDPSLATGSIAAGGTLGILIPPSIGFVIYGILTEESIGKLFLAGILPGILLSTLYILTIFIICKMKPELGPPGQKTPIIEKIVALKDTWGVILLFGLVMGGIYFGIFTPTEAAGIGAFGAFLIALARRKITMTSLLQCLLKAAQTTAMIFLIIIGAEIFTYFLSISKLPMFLANFMSSLPIHRYFILSAILLVYLLLGCVLDGIAMIALTIPIFFPVIQSLGFDPIWFGVLIVIVLEIGLITPPVGLNVFIIRGVAEDIPMSTIFRGIWPFLIASIIAIIIIILIPSIATYIPSNM